MKPGFLSFIQWQLSMHRVGSMKLPLSIKRDAPRSVPAPRRMCGLVFAAALYACIGCHAAAQSSSSEAGLPGSHVPDFTLSDYRGKKVSLSDFHNAKLVVLAFLGTECPLAKRYASRLEEISRNTSRDMLP
jgi:hypothetical protein